LRRVASQPRPNWQVRVERLGLGFHTGAEPYWYESAHYVLSSFEVSTLESATNRLHQMCVAAAGHVIEKRRYAELGIPEKARDTPTALYEADRRHEELVGRDLCAASHFTSRRSTTRTPPLDRDSPSVSP
jgi:glutathionylspermidine synthase